MSLGDSNFLTLHQRWTHRGAEPDHSSNKATPLSHSRPSDSFVSITGSSGTCLRDTEEGRLQGCCQRAPRCPRGTQGQGEYAAERQMHFQWAGCLLPTGQPCLFGRTKSSVWLQRRKGTCWEDTLIPPCGDRTLNSLDLVH